jgi:DNA-binding LytR/AlgR family response regulator
MEKVKIGIVEDDEVISRYMSLVLNDLGYQTTIPASNYDDAIKMLDSENPDLIMLDIQIEGQRDGIDIAEKINKTYNIPFIFLTSNSGKAIIDRAKKVFPSAYLIKPFNKDDLFTAIEICLNNFAKKGTDNNSLAHNKLNDFIFIKDGYYFHKIKTDDIYYLESDHVYVNIHTSAKKITVRASLNAYIENFSEATFFRPHRSYAININHVETINSEYVLINGEKIPITKQKREELLLRLKVV